MNDLTISFVGDIMLGRDHNHSNTFDPKLEAIRKKNFSKESLRTIYGTTFDILNSCDLLVGNLETAITDHEIKYPKTFNYRIKTKYARALKINPNTFLSIGNNHILAQFITYGYDYLLEKDSIKTDIYKCADKVYEAYLDESE